MTDHGVLPYNFDVVNVSDFRLPGGTSHSIAQEVAAQSKAGMHTGLLHLMSPMIRRPLPWSPAMLRAARLPMVDVITPETAVRTRLLVIRHPSSVSSLARIAPAIRTDHVVIVANHAAHDSDDSPNYDVIEIDRNISKIFGVRPEWRPIGPVVRGTLESFVSEIVIGDDWLNVIEMESRPRQRGPLSADRRVTIGRHSRPQPAKWPNAATDIRLAYPMDREFDVRILGGSQAAEQILKKRPSNWTVYEFGSREPSEFLSEIDYWVYFHHPSTLEAYGRAIMEALYSGCVVILPPYLSETFGDAAIYCTPAEVRDVVRTLSANPDAYLAQSRRGQDFVLRLGPDLHVKRVEEYGVHRREVPGSPLKARIGSDVSRGTLPQRVLFLTSNGAGMGHLTRLLAIARACDPTKIEPFFLSLSQGVPVVAAQGFAYEYVASSGAMRMAPAAWNDYFIHRLETVIASVNPAGIVFDGTVPYTGLIEVLQKHDLYKVWVRRAMWKEGTSAKSLSRDKYFDLVIEPGEYAAQYDRGPTKDRVQVDRVNPITLLRPDEVLSRESARAELGMDANAHTVLLTLGAGNINSIEDVQEAVIDNIAKRSTGWQVYVTKPPIAESTGKSSLNVLSTYPLARIAAAFDFAVSAAGYNSFHEWMSMGIPTLWVPNESTSVDDQVARARWAADSNVGAWLRSDDGVGLSDEIEKLVDDSHRSAIVRRLEGLPPADGAGAAAGALMEGLSNWRM